jgi:hypothetical protein
MGSEIEARNFTNLVYKVLLNVGRSVLKMMETLWKNSLIIAEGVRIFPVNFIVIANTRSEKTGGVTSVPPLIQS